MKQIKETTPPPPPEGLQCPLMPSEVRQFGGCPAEDLRFFVDVGVSVVVFVMLVESARSWRVSSCHHSDAVRTFQNCCCACQLPLAGQSSCHESIKSSLPPNSRWPMRRFQVRLRGTRSGSSICKHLIISLPPPSRGMVCEYWLESVHYSLWTAVLAVHQCTSVYAACFTLIAETLSRSLVLLPVTWFLPMFITSIWMVWSELKVWHSVKFRTATYWGLTRCTKRSASTI